MIILEKVRDLDYEILKVIKVAEEGLQNYCKQLVFDKEDD